MGRTFQPWTRRELQLHADPDCDQCDGTGVIDVTYNSRMDDSDEVACDCVGLEDEREPADLAVS